MDFFELEQKKENLHWLASRALINAVFQNQKIELSKDSFNKPSLKVNDQTFHISITHSFQFAAIIVSKNKTVAIDIEKLDERIQRVKHKFMRDDELEYLLPGNESIMLVSIWSAKETLYKFYGKKELDFKKNLKIESFIPQITFDIRGLIDKVQKQYHTIYVEIIDGYVLTYIL